MCGREKGVALMRNPEQCHRVGRVIHSDDATREKLPEAVLSQAVLSQAVLQVG